MGYAVANPSYDFDALYSYDAYLYSAPSLFPLSHLD